ncbi:hypothetical protein Tco_0759232 [Tanacetum coccineum]
MRPSLRCTVKRLDSSPAPGSDVNVDPSIFHFSCSKYLAASLKIRCSTGLLELKAIGCLNPSSSTECEDCMHADHCSRCTPGDTPNLIPSSLLLLVEINIDEAYNRPSLHCYLLDDMANIVVVSELVALLPALSMDCRKMQHIHSRCCDIKSSLASSAGKGVTLCDSIQKVRGGSSNIADTRLQTCQSEVAE